MTAIDEAPRVETTSGVKSSDLKRLKKLASKDKRVRKVARKGMRRLRSLRGKKRKLRKLSLSHHHKASAIWWVSGYNDQALRLMQVHLLLSKMARKSAKSGNGPSRQGEPSRR